MHFYFVLCALCSGSLLLLLLLRKITSNMENRTHNFYYQGTITIRAVSLSKTMPRIACQLIKIVCPVITLTNQYTQIDEVHPKITHCKHILGCTFLKITCTQSMFLLCKLFSMAIHSMGYFCDVTILYTDEWKLID